MQACAQERLVAVRGGKGWGKTRLLSWIYWWGQDCFEDTVTITTATTWTQVAEQLWREIHQAREAARMKLPGRLLDTKHEIAEKWFGLGLSTKKPESLAGFHASVRIAEKYQDRPDLWHEVSDDEFFDSVLDSVERAQDAPRVRVIVDEASGIEERLWPALDGLLTNPGSSMVIVGNPTRLLGRHWDIFEGPIDG